MGRKNKRKKAWQKVYKPIDPIWLLLVKASNKCHYCNRVYPDSEMTIDHVIPKSKGGKITKGNIVPACRICNGLKASMDYKEFVGISEAYRSASEL